MKSKWYDLKPKALKMRLNGASLRDINLSLNIPKSTLSGWLQDVELTIEQREKLSQRWKNGLLNARTKAIIWHNQQKQKRIEKAENEALEVLSRLDLKDEAILELALAMLYLGEGAKNYQTCLGNSNPLILNFFISAIKKVYNFDLSKIRCELHLRADQNPEELKAYWSKTLNLTLSQFTYVSLDKRTLGRPTYPTYKGVCILQCSNVALQRRLVYLSQRFCEKIANQRAV